MKNDIIITAISGSLRSSSSNTNVLKAIGMLAPANVQVRLYEKIGNLPLFNSETEHEALTAVDDLRSHIQQSDGVIICTPEYAFGTPGALKNALDWLVGSGELNNKPVAAISASPLYAGGDKALASLLLTLTALGTITPENITLKIPFINKKIDSSSVITDETTKEELSQLLMNFADVITKQEKDDEK